MIVVSEFGVLQIVGLILVVLGEEEVGYVDTKSCHYQECNRPHCSEGGNIEKKSRTTTRLAPNFIVVPVIDDAICQAIQRFVP